MTNIVKFGTLARGVKISVINFENFSAANSENLMYKVRILTNSHGLWLMLCLYPNTAEMWILKLAPSFVFGTQECPCIWRIIVE